MSPSRHSHSHTDTHQPASQATDSQTNPLPNQGGACSISAPASLSPPHHHWGVGGQDHPQPPSPRLPGPSYSQMTEQPPPTKAAKVAAKKPKVNLRLDSAVVEASSTTPGMHPNTSCWGRRPSRPLCTPVHTDIFCFCFYLFLLGVVSVEGTDIRTENEQEGMGEIFRRWQGAEGQVMVLPGGLEGAWRGPVQQAGERESGRRHGRRAVLLKIPALPEMTDSATQPQAPPHLSLHTPAQHTLGSQP